MTDAYQPAKRMSEDELQDAVIQTATLLGWRVAHFRPALTKKGWRTPVEGHGAGFPDLVLVRVRSGRDARLILAELKSQQGALSDEQNEWYGRLAMVADAVAALADDAGADDRRPPLEVVVWRPKDWLDGAVHEALR